VPAQQLLEAVAVPLPDAVDEGMPIATGGWCMATSAGPSRVSSRTASSQPIVSSASQPSSCPGMVESHRATVSPATWRTWFTGRSSPVTSTESTGRGRSAK
jgi:hypothetical protein